MRQSESDAVFLIVLNPFLIRAGRCSIIAIYFWNH